MKSRCAQGHTPSEGSRGVCFPCLLASSGSKCPFACGRIDAISARVFTWFLCVLNPPLSSLIRTPVIGLRAQDHPGWFCLVILNWIEYTETLFQISHIHRNWRLRFQHIFSGAILQPTIHSFVIWDVIYICVQFLYSPLFSVVKITSLRII